MSDQRLPFCLFYKIALGVLERSVSYWVSAKNSEEFLVKTGFLPGSRIKYRLSLNTNLE